MKLLTKELCGNMPGLYSQEEVGDPWVVAKFFTPWTFWTWYATEASVVKDDFDGNECHFSLDTYEDGDEVLFFGLVCGQENELGYWTLADLQSVKGPVGLKIERDIYWDPKKLSEVEKMVA